MLAVGAADGDMDTNEKLDTELNTDLIALR